MDKAYKLLLDPDQKKRALDVIHAGKEYVEHMVSVVYTLPHIPGILPLFVAQLSWSVSVCFISAILHSQQVKEKKKQLKKDGKLLDVEEDDPEMVKS